MSFWRVLWSHAMHPNGRRCRQACSSSGCGHLRHLPDVREGSNNQRYTLEDTALSALEVFLTQSPSFLDYQVRMQKECGRNNATALFGVHRIPSDQQIRNLLDPVAPRAPRASTDGHRYRTLSAGCVDDPPGADGWLPARVRWHPVLRLIRDFLSPMFHPDPGQRRGPVLPPGRHPSLGRSEPGCRVPAPPRVVAPQDYHRKLDCELAASARW